MRGKRSPGEPAIPDDIMVIGMLALASLWIAAVEAVAADPSAAITPVLTAAFSLGNYGSDDQQGAEA